jgi:hypothetical protein
MKGYIYYIDRGIQKENRNRVSIARRVFFLAEGGKYVERRTSLLEYVLVRF